MRDLELIHAKEDIGNVLQLAIDAGLTIRVAEPTPTPSPVIIDSSRLNLISSGVFDAYRDEWMFDDLVYHKIDEGGYKGKYSYAPTVNYVGIQFYFIGERKGKNQHTLGNGFVSRDLKWYDPAAHEVYAAPPEVKGVFDTICKRLDTRVYVHAGVHKYLILGGALKKIKVGYLPPFDFIEWPAELVGHQRT